MASDLFKRVLRTMDAGAFPGARRFVWKVIYNTLGRFWRDPDWRFMNYGWLPPEGAMPIELAAEDEPERPFIGLYDHVVRGLPLAGARVLEIGCGRGGGARYVARYFQPSEVLGVDFSAPATDLARRLNSDTANLSFAVGDAERLDLPDASFDIVLNVESSHCYGNMDKFVAESVRVLKPGGWFGWADMRSKATMAATKQSLAHPGMQLERFEDISADVVRALDAANARKQHRIARVWLVRRFMAEFAGTKGSLLYRGLISGEVVYKSGRFRKL
jgi:SAM-dependent methyltransferase